MLNKSSTSSIAEAFFLYRGGGVSLKPYVILMGGHAKCLLLMTRGEGGGSKIPKTCLRNTWMFPKEPSINIVEC